jgi:hypothetical protein
MARGKGGSPLSSIDALVSSALQLGAEDVAGWSEEERCLAKATPTIPVDVHELREQITAGGDPLGEAYPQRRGAPGPRTDVHAADDHQVHARLVGKRSAAASGHRPWLGLGPVHCRRRRTLPESISRSGRYRPDRHAHDEREHCGCRSGKSLDGSAPGLPGTGTGDGRRTNALHREPSLRQAPSD